MAFGWPTRPAGLREHLFIGHGMWTEDEKTRKGLVEAHKHGHSGQESGRPIPHTHPGLTVAHGKPQEHAPVCAAPASASWPLVGPPGPQEHRVAPTAGGRP